MNSLHSMDIRNSSPLPQLIVQLWIKADTRRPWVPILTIPSNEISLYTLSPLKWLRFLGFAIYGREGMLRVGPDGPEVNDYTLGTEDIGVDYYYWSPNTPRLVDIRGMSDRVSDASYSCLPSTLSNSNDIVARDGTCVMSGTPALHCTMAHLIPHSKGDKYIQCLTEFRCSAEEDHIQSIDDPRNTLLLNTIHHRILGSSGMAFLKTPNFALDTDDVPPSPQPVSGPSGRLTIQYFCEPFPLLHACALPNQDARPPNDLTTWPPSVITDFLYACVALKKWGSDGSRTVLHQSTQDYYYNPQQDSPKIPHGSQQNLEQPGSQKSQHGVVMDWLLSFQSTNS